MANMTPVNALESTLTVAYKEGTTTVITLLAIADFPTAGVVTMDDGEEWVIKVYSATDVPNKELETLTNATAVYKSAGAVGHTFAIGTKVWMTQAADYAIQYPIGPAASTDHALARWDGATGRLLLNSGIIVNDTDDISGVHGLTATGNLDIGAHDFRARNLTADALTAGRLVYTGVAGLLSAAAAGTWDGTTLGIDGAAVFNNSEADKDFRVAGSGDTNSLCVQGSDGFVGVGTATPVARLHVYEENAVTSYIIVEATGVNLCGMQWKNDGTIKWAISDRSADSDPLYFAASPAGGGGADIAAAAVLTLRQDGLVGIGILLPTAKLHTDQSSTTGAVPVLALDQADLSEGFINYIGTSAASAVGPISSWTVAALEGYYAVELNGVRKWTPYYADPTA